MNKHFWKIEYSITLFFIFAVVIFIIPPRFISSNTAENISKWNEVYTKMDFVFTAMSAQADSDIVMSLKKEKNPERRQEFMIELVKPYLRLQEFPKILKHYKAHYMNGSRVSSKDFYYFSNLYLSDNNRVVGIKDIKNNDPSSPGFMIMADMNGIKGPNRWGKDIFGIKIYKDGTTVPIGSDWDLAKLRKDCSPSGTGVGCSHFYRIGGEFNE